MDDSLASCLDLMRRLPPQKVQQNLDLLIDIVPDLADDILSSVDQPLQVQQDQSGRDYLVSVSSTPPVGVPHLRRSVVSRAGHGGAGVEAGC